MSFKIILVDDHNIVRRGLAALLRNNGKYVLVGEASNGEEALIRAKDSDADLMILDLSMPRMNGLETIRRLNKIAPRLKVLVLSMYDDEQFVAQALRDGARGYILKHAMDEEFFQALDTVVSGKIYVSAEIDMDKIDAQNVVNAELTEREREVLQLIAEGKTTQNIAEQLSISPHTATRHRANLMQKLCVHNQAELIRAAVKLGLVILPKST
ncbi:MAG: response regulator transcription factor [Anaerolineae bacterium]|nr:response regulator transcription factor [Anaerolineae bacterium]